MSAKPFKRKTKTVLPADLVVHDNSKTTTESTEKDERGLRDNSKTTIQTVQTDERVDPMIQNLLQQLQALPRQDNTPQQATSQKPTDQSATTGQPPTQTSEQRKATRRRRTSRKQKGGEHQNPKDDISLNDFSQQKPTDNSARTQRPMFQMPTVPVGDLPGAMTLEMIESPDFDFEKG